MGNNWSKSWPAVRERMRRARAGPAARTESAAAGVGAVSQDLDKYGAVTINNTAANNPAVLGSPAHGEREEDSGKRPQVPLRPMTYKGALDLSHFLKEKGGLDGLIYSQQRQDILDLWVYNTQGYFPDWQNYTPGPGVRYPLTFGWCYKLVPVDPDEVEKATEGENNSLLHPICQHGMDDPEKEVLIWRFDSRLALRHRAQELHPEFYKN
uniref:Protein Nef n=1 Tax=Human immunodeficiency virus type 1 TaxID=11676 RepID=A0A1P8P009_HV1|nr:nef protein [Human immunodeficiency virus 1]